MSNTTTYTNFLDIPPSEVRDFTLPTYSFEYSEDMLGKETRRVISDDGRHSEMTIFYNHLNGAEVELLISFYKERVPVGRGFGLPQGLLDYPDRLFQEYLTTLGQVIYFFKRRPIIATNAVNDSYSVILYLEAKSVSLGAPSQITGILTPTVTLSVDSTVPFVFWEQLEGQELIIADPFSTTTTATATSGNITNVLGEITVRVSLIDSPNVFQDISINARPVDTARYTLSSRSVFIEEINPSYKVVLPIQWGYSSDPSEANLNENDTNDFDPFVARWLPPVDDTYLVRYDIEVWDTVSWNTVATISADDSISYGGFNPEEVFRIVAVHLLPGASDEIRAASDILFIDPPNAIGDIVTGADVFPEISSRLAFAVETDTDLDVTLVELIAPDDDEFWRGSLRNQVGFIVETDTNLDLVNGGEIPEDDFFYAHHRTSLVYITETDFLLEGGIIG